MALKCIQVKALDLFPGGDKINTHLKLGVMQNSCSKITKEGTDHIKPIMIIFNLIPRVGFSSMRFTLEDLLTKVESWRLVTRLSRWTRLISLIWHTRKVWMPWDLHKTRWYLPAILHTSNQATMHRLPCTSRGRRTWPRRMFTRTSRSLWSRNLARVWAWAWWDAGTDLEFLYLLWYGYAFCQIYLQSLCKMYI